MIYLLAASAALSVQSLENTDDWIPASFRGHWAKDLETCRDDSFHVSAGLVSTNHTTIIPERISFGSPAAMTVVGHHYSGPEGVFGRPITIKLERPEAAPRLLISFDGTRLELIRCPRPPDPDYEPPIEGE